jgi:N-acetylmuramoyl-L-alanine amidase
MNGILKKLAIVIILLWSGLSFGQNQVESKYQSCKNDYTRLLNTNLKTKRVNWVRVVKCFENISNLDSSGKRGEDSLFTIAMLYKQLYSYSSIESDLDNALRYFGLVAQKFPNTGLADDSIYSRARIYNDQKKDYTKAYLELSELTETYPNSDSAQKARPLLAEIKKKRPKDSSEDKSEPLVQSQPPIQKRDVAQIKEIKHWTNPDYTRVAIYLDSRANYNYNVLDVDEKNLMPRRIYVDIGNTAYANDLAGNIQIKDGLLTRARVGKFKKEITRVVLDAEKDFDYNVFAWEDPFRIIIDIRSKDAREKQSIPVVDLAMEDTGKKPEEIEINEPIAPKNTAVPEKPEGKEEETKSKNIAKVEPARPDVPPIKKTPQFIKRVVIDAGHGGKDDGAKGKGGSLEKDIVLSIARKVRDNLSKDDNIEVIMTRDDDTFIPLEARTGMAVQAQADLFVSIHANAHKNKRVHGVSTYFLDDTDDQESIMTALKENYSQGDYTAAVDSKETKDLLSYTFASLQKNYDTIRSIPLADMIHKGMLKSLKRSSYRVGDLGVRKGIFWVLCGTNTPAVLVETSFVSNPDEEAKLKSSRYQDSLAQGIADGIRQYLSNPVAMSGYTYIEAKKTAN